jgi:hypothetical protein
MKREYKYREGADAKLEFETAMKALFKAPKQPIKKEARTPAPSRKRGKDAP